MWKPVFCVVDNTVVRMWAAERGDVELTSTDGGISVLLRGITKPVMFDYV